MYPYLTALAHHASQSRLQQQTGHHTTTTQFLVVFFLGLALILVGLMRAAANRFRAASQRRAQRQMSAHL